VCPCRVVIGDPGVDISPGLVEIEEDGLIEELVAVITPR
jgi:hypothetical protein